MAGSRYSIGIDLGTSNSVLAYVDLLEENSVSRVMPVSQRSASGAVTVSPVLPSMVFLPPGDGEPVIGIGAKEEASNLPGRVIQSAKSWLSESWSAAENGGRVLPWESEEIDLEARLTPVEVSAMLLRCFREEWNRTIGAFSEEYSFDRQQITITVPASFDEMAVKLTRDAAERAGFPATVRLLEEPQAAFYSWLETHSDLELLAELARSAPGGVASVLVCDVGGGTTDFSLFEVRPGDLLPEIRRIAVSDHILLGGDNIDMALSFELARRFADSGKQLGRTQLSHLLVQSRALKEEILAREEEDRVHQVSLPSVGSGLFAGAMTTAIAEREVRSVVVDGFFPRARIADQLQGVRGGLQERGLPYAKDSAVTRHLAQFLANAAYAKGRSIDGVLFAGGTLTPAFLRERIVEVVGSWQESKRPREIEAGAMDLAVARGAAYYGALVSKQRNQIRAAYARSLFIEVGGAKAGTAVCIVPRGLEAEERVRIERTFELKVGVPVRFQLWYSSLREGDRPGDLVAVDESAFRRLPTVEVVVTPESFDAVATGSESIAVVLEAVINQLGRLEMYFVPAAGGTQHYMLSFDLRNDAPSGERMEEAELQVDAARVAAAAEHIREYYGKKKSGSDGGPKRLPKELETALGLPRDEWAVPLLRELWLPLQEGITRRGRSVAHEATWLSLAGYFLRPGYGAVGDEGRITELWRCYALGMSFPKESSVVTQWWIMWRRVAGGLTASAQRELFKKVRPLLREKRSDSMELFRLAASLEWLTAAEKEELGEAILQRLAARSAIGNTHFIWSFGRLASRVPLYAPHDTVVPAKVVAGWLERMLKLDWKQLGQDELCRACAVAVRRVDDSRDIEPELRQRVLERMRSVRAAAELVSVVEHFVPFAQSESSDLYGESLPAGLTLLS